MSSPTTNLIFAQGPVGSSGQPQQHYAEGDADVSLSSGAVSGVNTSSKQSLKDAHAWLMAIS